MKNFPDVAAQSVRRTDHILFPISACIIVYYGLRNRTGCFVDDVACSVLCLETFRLILEFYVFPSGRNSGAVSVEKGMACVILPV